MNEALSEFESRNVSVIAIGQSTGAEAAHYMRKWELELTCLGDVSGHAYAAFGMLRGNVWTVMLRAMLIAPIKSIGLTLQADRSGMMLASGLVPVLFGWLLDIGQPAWVFWLSGIFVIGALFSFAAARGRAAVR